MAKNKPEYIILHHTAVSYSKNPDQYEATKRYHISKGWGDIGYHYEISKNGKLYKGRHENTPGAHTYQNNMNYRSIGICLDGNFDIEVPTKQQEETLRKLLQELVSKYNIPIKNIIPHRHYASYKSCFGSKLNDSWGQDLLKVVYDEKLAEKWEGKFLLDVEDNGKVYYIFNKKRIYVNPSWNMRDFVINHSLQHGFKHIDILKIEESK